MDFSISPESSNDILDTDPPKAFIAIQTFDETQLQSLLNFFEKVTTEGTKTISSNEMFRISLAKIYAGYRFHMLRNGYLSDGNETSESIVMINRIYNRLTDLTGILCSYEVDSHSSHIVLHEINGSVANAISAVYTSDKESKELSEILDRTISQLEIIERSLSFRVERNQLVSTELVFREIATSHGIDSTEIKSVVIQPLASQFIFNNFSAQFSTLLLLNTACANIIRYTNDQDIQVEFGVDRYFDSHTKKNYLRVAVWNLGGIDIERLNEVNGLLQKGARLGPDQRSADSHGDALGFFVKMPGVSLFATGMPEDKSKRSKGYFELYTMFPANWFTFLEE